MIELQSVTFDYQKTSLFHDLSLNIPKGSIYGLLGVNGAGKTTLLKLISGQLFVQGGTVNVLGYDPGRRDPRMLQDMFYIPEEFYLPSGTPEEYLKVTMPFYPKFSLNTFNTYAEIFKLDLSKKLQAFSFGQKKKFLLAFGLAANTSLLILDEPTNGLDIPSKTQFRRSVASAISDDRSFIISTHQVKDVENLIDPVLILHDGRIIFHHPLEDVEKSITIELQKEPPSEHSYVFSEQVPGGYCVVREKRPEDPERAADLEALFNTVTAVPEAIEQLIRSAETAQKTYSKTAPAESADSDTRSSI